MNALISNLAQGCQVFSILGANFLFRSGQIWAKLALAIFRVAPLLLYCFNPFLLTSVQIFLILESNSQ